MQTQCNLSMYFDIMADSGPAWDEIGLGVAVVFPANVKAQVRLGAPQSTATGLH